MDKPKPTKQSIQDLLKSTVHTKDAKWKAIQNIQFGSMRGIPAPSCKGCEQYKGRNRCLCFGGCEKIFKVARKNTRLF